MRRYMYVLGALYVLYGLTFLISPTSAAVVSSGVPTLQGGGDQFFGAVFIAVGAFDIIVAYVRYNPRFPHLNSIHNRPVQLRLIALGATIVLTCAWVTTMIIATLFYGAAPGGVFLWAYILYAQTQTIGYHDLAPETEKQLVDMLQTRLKPPDSGA